ncbi:MAG TPA: electron transfer flavoprotein subunit beta/FixA family protein [Thermoanaerobaculia bacterium]|jgi:electron transfer flavoprotein beta subunit|nr:electron transfer flavoprotein subunit beta/FixA family protein [Thermoanaerobaculia bacterium]
MNILVCMKQILDPEVPARDFRIDATRKEAERGSASLVTNIFCENALETALQFRPADARITVLSYGPASAEETLRKALAMKADAAALVLREDDAAPADPLHAARVLAAAARKLGTFDLILTGREAGDWGAGQTGALLAEELRLPCIAFADTLSMDGGKLRVKRQTEWGWELFEAETPVVVTITNDEHNVPRIPKVRDVMLAHRQPLTQFTLAELGVSAANDYYEVEELFIPKKESACELVAGDTLEQKVDVLARRLVEVTASL